MDARWPLRHRGAIISQIIIAHAQNRHNIRIWLIGKRMYGVGKRMAGRISEMLLGSGN